MKKEQIEAQSKLGKLLDAHMEDDCSELPRTHGYDDFDLIDKLATVCGIAQPESREERNGKMVYRRRVLRKAIEIITS